MEEVKATKEYKIFKKRSGRYAVEDVKGNPINGKKKAEILFGENLIKSPPPKNEAPVVEVVAATPTDEAAA